MKRLLPFLLFLLAPTPAFATGDGVGIMIVGGCILIGGVAVLALYLAKWLLEICGVRFRPSEGGIGHWLKVLSIPVIFIVANLAIPTIENYYSGASHERRDWKRAEQLGQGSPELLTPLAQAGDKSAQHRLGVYYFRDAKDTPQNRAAAYFWLSLSGDKIAAADVAALMSPEEVAAAKKRAGEWKPGKK